jgi:hypothetical protein
LKIERKKKERKRKQSLSKRKRKKKYSNTCTTFLIRGARKLALEWCPRFPSEKKNDKRSVFFFFLSFFRFFKHLDTLKNFFGWHNGKGWNWCFST